MEDQVCTNVSYSIKSVQEVVADTRRGGVVKTLLSPKTCDARSGFMGVATLNPGEQIAEHYHPYSDEFVYVSRGTLVAELNGEHVRVCEGTALHIPLSVRHRLFNFGPDMVEISFFIAPLAPRPELGHVDTERRANG